MGSGHRFNARTVFPSSLPSTIFMPPLLSHLPSQSPISRVPIQKLAVVAVKGAKGSRGAEGRVWGDGAEVDRTALRSGDMEFVNRESASNNAKGILRVPCLQTEGIIRGRT